MNAHLIPQVLEVLIIQSCPTLCNLIDCNPPGSSVHRIVLARILEWVDISSSRGSSPSRDQTRISCIGRFFTTESPGKPIKVVYNTAIQNSGEGNGTQLQYSCLEDPMDGGAW